ncbi:hypothetical protein L7G72_20220 [Xenorhabdus bovienii]|uniref:structural cement protein Gp24 n=1 Tax=Xenorhabdus bovienii TaxID=40576 RepID=UPI001EE03327|nr:hypothetical protein [Xenorhabdus bovienii]MCG3464083.1 hypothetical protein [Xenorhabdus bovienii]
MLMSKEIKKMTREKMTAKQKTFCREYMTVKLDGDASSIKKGAPVYVRVGKPAQTSPLGSFLNVAIDGETVVLPNAQFTGSGDADGNVEISYKI